VAHLQELLRGKMAFPHQSAIEAVLEDTTPDSFATPQVPVLAPLTLWKLTGLAPLTGRDFFFWGLTQLHFCSFRQRHYHKEMSILIV
jgi:hypothetical protein